MHVSASWKGTWENNRSMLCSACPPTMDDISNLTAEQNHFSWVALGGFNGISRTMCEGFPPNFSHFWSFQEQAGEFGTVWSNTSYEIDEDTTDKDTATNTILHQ